MQQQCLTFEQTLAEIITWRPALEKLLKALSPLISAKENLASNFAKDFAANPWSLPLVEATRLQLGVSLLSDYDFPDANSYFRKAREVLWPHLATFQALAPNLDPYYQYFNQVPLNEQSTLWRSVLSNDATILQTLANEHSLEPTIFHFIAQNILQSILKGLVINAFDVLNLNKVMPWDQNNTWQQGYCPVCGAYPTLAWLDKPTIDERNPYLLEGGGKKHLHCGQCGANWRFLRLSCPNCGVAESKQIEIMTCADDAHGESLDWCNKCNCYCPTVDLRERTAIPNFEAQALGMIHLEFIAKEKDLHPLRQSFWNAFA